MLIKNKNKGLTALVFIPHSFDFSAKLKHLIPIRFIHHYVLAITSISQ